jgi:hypothetical protein
MDVFEYIAVMVTVVLALAVSHILTSLATMVANPERVRPYWVHLLWAVLLLGLNLQAWLVLWSLRVQSEWSVGQIVMMLLSASLIFVAARVLEPELPRGECVDLRSHYSRIRLPFFLTLSIFWLFPILGRFLFVSGNLLEPMMIGRIAFFVLSLSGAAVKSSAWHATLAILWACFLVGSLTLIWGGLS